MSDVAALPAFFFVGVGKCGTSWLYDFLRSTGMVDVPKIKEPYLVDMPAPERSAALARLYANDRRPKADFSNLYYWDADNAAKIRDLNPDARVVVTVRRPSGRALSHFRFLRRNGIIDDSTFESYLERGDEHAVVARSDYHPIVERYEQALGASQVLVLPLELLRSDPATYVERLGAFLEVELPRPTEADAAPVLGAQEPRVRLLAKAGWLLGGWLRRRGLLRVLASFKESAVVRRVLFRDAAGAAPTIQNMPPRLTELDASYPSLLASHGVLLGELNGG